MSRPVEVLVMVDLDLLERTDPTPARCVTAVGDPGWNADHGASATDVERGISLVLDALGQRLADVTGELSREDADPVQRAADELAHARLEAMSAAQRVGHAEQAYAAALRAGGVRNR